MTTMDGSGWAIIVLLVAWGLTALVLSIVIRGRGQQLDEARQTICNREKELAVMQRRLDYYMAKAKVEGLTDAEALRDFNDVVVPPVDGNKPG